MANIFKRDEIVKVLRLNDYDEYAIYSEEMEMWVGKLGTIVQYDAKDDTYEVALDNGDYKDNLWFYSNDLVKAETATAEEKVYKIGETTHVTTERGTYTMVVTSFEPSEAFKKALYACYMSQNENVFAIGKAYTYTDICKAEMILEETARTIEIQTTKGETIFAFVKLQGVKNI